MNGDRIIAGLRDAVAHARGDVEAARVSSAGGSMNAWQDIATAPRTGERIILYRPNGLLGCECVFGEWDDDHYAKTPRPFWRDDQTELMGKLWARKAQPTHWQPRPAPPIDPERTEDAAA